MNILLVEDIELQEQWLRDELSRAFRCEPIWIQTESEFRSRLDEIEARPPDVAVIDVMLKWADPSPDSPPAPPEWDRHKAGLHCQELLSSREKTRNMPVILYTVLDATDLRSEELPPNVSLLNKDSDPEPLIKRIREVTALSLSRQ